MCPSVCVCVCKDESYMENAILWSFDALSYKYSCINFRLLNTFICKAMFVGLGVVLFLLFVEFFVLCHVVFFMHVYFICKKKNKNTKNMNEAIAKLFVFTFFISRQGRGWFE